MDGNGVQRNAALRAGEDFGFPEQFAFHRTDGIIDEIVMLLAVDEQTVLAAQRIANNERITVQIGMYLGRMKQRR